MLKYRHTYKGEGSFIAWMFRTARNVNFDNYKKNKQSFNEKAMSELVYKLEDSDSVEKGIEHKDDLSILHRAMQLLAPEKREVLVLSKFKELKFSQIGEILECSEGAAKVKSHRALKDLRLIFLQLETR